MLDLLVKHMNQKKGALVVVLMGSPILMEDLMRNRPQLPAEFPTMLTFHDYSDTELGAIMNNFIAAEKPTFHLPDAKHTRIAARRARRMRGTSGFENAHGVRNLYEKAFRQQASRVIRQQKQGLTPDALRLERDDLLGPMYHDLSSSDALRELAAMQGLESVKASVESLLQLIRTNADREEMELRMHDVSLHRVYMGNPGTGE